MEKKNTEKGEKQKKNTNSNLGKSKSYNPRGCCILQHWGKKLREMSNNPKCKFALFVGNKCLIKRKSLEEYLKHTSYI